MGRLSAVAAWRSAIRLDILVGVSPRVFLSHISEEAPIARALKEGLEMAVPGVQVFVSAVNIHPGQAWLSEISEALVNSEIVLALCSPSSVRRPWLNFESGSGWSKGLPVVPICHLGMRKDRLPDPMRIFHAIELDDGSACTVLVNQLSTEFGIAIAKDFDAKKFFEALRTKPAHRTSDVGIVLCHRQSEWDEGNRTVFALFKSLPNDLEGNWSFKTIEDERTFLSPDLHELSGLLLASPWRGTMEPETIAAIVGWVRDGGRLLLLGYELGDRHHNGNLAELSHHFGIDPANDIVGPQGYGDRKPYDEPVDFRPHAADAHQLTDDLTTIRLSNVQTIRVDAGGTEWLRVGENVVYRPRRDSVRYRDGTMTAPGETPYENNPTAGWLPVAVEAPHGLCGAGSVHMIGTWDLLGRHQPFGGDNLTLVTRLLDWLSRKSG